MSEQTTPHDNHTPDELTRWVDQQVKVLEQRLRATKRSARLVADRKRYVLELLDALSDMQTVSERMVHLLTAYALRESIASGTEVAKASDVTFTGATSRVAGKLARSAWHEVFETTPPAGG